MKLKCQPEDFFVEENVNIVFDTNGLYSIYKLEKQFWDTFDLLDYLSRKYKLKQIGRAGIKDRYSHSIQYISIKDDKQKQIKEDNFSLNFIGRSNTPVTQNILLKNFFRIVIRDLTEKEVKNIQNNLVSVRKYGSPNYYDEQRMGSARAKQGFIAQKLILGHYNGALKLYLATPSKFDDSRTRKLKKHLNEHWGKWDDCLQASTNLKQFRYPLLYLVKHPKDFKGAIKTIRRDLIEMFINAYQAYLWNETLKKIIVNRQIDFYSRTYHFGELYFYNELLDKNILYFNNLSIPAPSPKAEFIDAMIKQVMEQALENESKQTKQEITLKKLKIDLGIKGLFFKPYERKAIIIPEQMKAEGPSPDDLYENKYKIILSFTLNKGSYATMLIKRITS